MRYYKQFHGWPYVHLLALVFGCACLCATFFWREPATRVALIASAIVALGVGWILWKGRLHYLEIDQERIVHHGFKHWVIKKADLVRVEHGRRSWVEERDPYLTIHTSDREYPVDGGFLINERRIEELTRAMQGTGGTYGA